MKRAHFSTRAKTGAIFQAVRAEKEMREKKSYLFFQEEIVILDHMLAQTRAMLRNNSDGEYLASSYGGYLYIYQRQQLL